MAAPTEAQIKQDGQTIWRYLIGFYSKKIPKDQVVDKLGKLTEKIAKRLGMAGYYNVLVGNLPGAKLASFTASWMKLMYFEGYFTANPNLNPYDPLKQEDEYVEYLLYSWSRGKPGYRYFDVAASWNPNYQKR
ncbi:MAG: hypothetical protein UZ17_ACD001000624 [Acidobacteria bacterium OLB17]|nr:MAG: hypothetical protein UZ17_ACD001000624 [Acidobacteria bacterium OLB17]MCZ2390583.1 hypothetical protein [Acidobacteriota bacterium]